MVIPSTMQTHTMSHVFIVVVQLIKQRKNTLCVIAPNAEGC